MQRGATVPFIISIVKRALNNERTRKRLLKAIENSIYKVSLDDKVDRPNKVKLDRFYMARALLNSMDKAFSTDSISKESVDKLSTVFLSKIFIKGIHTRRKFKEINGFRPPGFITISPTNVCNLKCKGCYAGDIYTPYTLDYEVFDKIICDMKKEFQAHFFVISGGEPFMYRSKSKSLLDILAKHDDAYFLIYTNSTLISEEVAKRLGKIGNATPAISVEGFKEETDLRRGKGVYDKIMQAMDNLKKEGVLFGISVTPCSHNADLLLSDEFIDFYFNKKGAFYGWYFQYMPIGRKPSTKLLVSPQRRKQMYERIWKKVREDKVFIADFWNSGTASDGCMAAARGGGYFYIMWDGTITPCVFIPFVDKDYSNIHEVYERGETLTDVIRSPFFSAIREWQYNYWLNQPKQKCGNLLAPCIIRDNSEVFKEVVEKTGAKPVDEGANYYMCLVKEGKMPEYNRSWRKLTDPIWRKDYLERV